MNLCLGIDPGTYTGVALWDADEKRFAMLQAMSVHRALEYVAQTFLTHPMLPVIFEDARQRQWFGHTGREKLQGAGAAKRDASIWQDFLEDKGTPYLARRPGSGSTKWPADKFARITGHTERTNEHARDAGVLVYGLTAGEIASVVRSWEQQRANTARRTSAGRR